MVTIKEFGSETEVVLIQTVDHCTSFIDNILDVMVQQVEVQLVVTQSSAHKVTLIHPRGF